MSRICSITGRKSIFGNRRSHAMNATKRRFFPNLQFHRFWSRKENRYIRLRVSVRGMRILDKNEDILLCCSDLHK
ncbi:MAG: 50S ribosomal subunit protein L28 [Candidatus Westeberhardia cardiocondylae]|nr:50S ribosomal subunit protein L28 [Candidatus Westeberhardia cardiocondylae]